MGKVTLTRLQAKKCAFISHNTIGLVSLNIAMYYNPRVEIAIVWGAG